MYWFGWIPILTPNLLKKEAFVRLRSKNSDFLGENEHIVIPEPIYLKESKLTLNSLKKTFNDDAVKLLKKKINWNSEEIFYLLRYFGDIHPYEFKIIALTVENNVIKDIGIFSYPEFIVEAIANIIEIEDTGLVKFIITETKLEPIYSKHLFGEIRDIYHEHVYVPHGDFPLKPVFAKKRENAIEEIFYQFEKKILAYHRNIKNSIKDIEDRCEVSSIRNFVNITNLISSGMGEMTYALSFINQFSLSGHRKYCIKNSYNSLKILSNKVTSFETLRPLTVNIKVFFLTLLATGFFTYNVLESKLDSWKAILFSFFSVVGIWALMALHSFFTSMIKEKDII